MKRLINSLKIAFAMYSKLPAGNPEWTKDNLQYVLCFFPWVGVVVGAVFAGWFYLSDWVGCRGIHLPSALVTAVFVVIPVAVTGGIHLDGMLDTTDALASWQEKDKRLEILKDSHAGAFAIIAAAVYFVLCFGTYSGISRQNIWMLACGFVLSRTLSGLSVVTFPLAKGTGLAATFADRAKRRTVQIVLTVYLVGLTGIMLVIHWQLAILCLVLAGITVCYYRCMAGKQFGGITGDLAGWFLQICELVTAMGIVIMS